VKLRETLKRSDEHGSKKRETGSRLTGRDQPIIRVGLVDLRKHKQRRGKLSVQREQGSDSPGPSGPLQWPEASGEPGQERKGTLNARF